MFLVFRRRRIISIIIAIADPTVRTMYDYFNMFALRLLPRDINALLCVSAVRPTRDEPSVRVAQRPR